MNKAIKILLIVFGFIVLTMVFMAIFNVCPPNGSWPMPPWCKEGMEMQLPSIPSLPNVSIPDINPTISGKKPDIPEKTSFDPTGGGCFPPKGDCYRIPDEINRKRCNDYQSLQKVSWPMNCSIFQNTGCRTLCESQKGVMPPLEMSGPIKLSNNPIGLREWAWPHIFNYNGKLLVQYWGSVNGWVGNYVIIKTETGWTAPKDLKSPGTLILGKGENYLLAWSGNEGSVNLVVLDEDFIEKKTLHLESKQDFRSWALGAVDSTGKLHIAWNTFSNSIWSLKYASYENEIVSPAQEVTSSTESQYGATPWVIVDSNDIVYLFWVQSVNHDNEAFYAYMKDGKWSNPIDLSNSKEDDCWNLAFPNKDEVHFFEQACGSNHTADLHHIIFKEGDIAKQEIIDMPFSGGYVAFEGDKMHMIAYEPGLSKVKGNVLSLKYLLDYRYFDGSNWFFSQIVPQVMIDNYGWIKIDLTPGIAESQMGIAPDGSREFVHEEHPEVVLIDGVLHVVFEYNQNDTFDAYYMTIKPSAE